MRTRPIARSFVFTYNRNVFVIYQSERNSTHTYLVAPRTMYVQYVHATHREVDGGVRTTYVHTTTTDGVMVVYV